MYYECIELCALFENVYFNLQNLVHFLRNCIHWIYIIVTLFEKCVYWIYKIVYILLKNVQCTKLDAIFERCVCWVEYIQNQLWTMFEKCVHWIIKLCRLNVQTCDIVWKIYTLNVQNWLHSWKIVYFEYKEICKFNDTILKNIHNSIHSLNNVYVQCT